MQQRPSMKSSSVNSAWQRSTLGYKERFVDDFHYNNVRVRQFPCRAVFEKALCDAFGPSFLTEDDLDGTKSCYDDEVDNDRVPDTAFTVWESSVLLGMYASRKDVWNRLIGRSKLKYTSRPIVTLELGSGTGVASLLVATSKVVWESNCDCQVVMTDLPSTINFTRLNVHANIDKIPANAQIVVASRTLRLYQMILCQQVNQRRKISSSCMSTIPIGAISYSSFFRQLQSTM